MDTQPNFLFASEVANMRRKSHKEQEVLSCLQPNDFIQVLTTTQQRLANQNLYLKLLTVLSNFWIIKATFLLLQSRIVFNES